jgi:hypothetical protein
MFLKKREMTEDGTELFEELMRFKPIDLSPNAWAVKAGVSRTIWNDLKRHGNPSRKTLEKLLFAAGSSLAEFEALRVGPAAIEEGGPASSLGERSGAFRDAELPPLPLVQCHAAGEWGQAGLGVTSMSLERAMVLEWLPRPQSMANDPEAFAITVIDHGMWPRFRPGRRLAVSPLAKIDTLDDVLIILQGSAAPDPVAPVLLKELAGRSADALTLRQYTPDITFDLPIGSILSVYPILGELI